MPRRTLIAAAAIILIALLTDVIGAAAGLSTLHTDLLAIPIGLVAIGILVSWSSGMSPIARRQRRRSDIARR